jgi:hypothetical protein
MYFKGMETRDVSKIQRSLATGKPGPTGTASRLAMELSRQVGGLPEFKRVLPTLADLRISGSLQRICCGGPTDAYGTTAMSRIRFPSMVGEIGVLTQIRRSLGLSLV